MIKLIGRSKLDPYFLQIIFFFFFIYLYSHFFFFFFIYLYSKFFFFLFPVCTALCPPLKTWEY